MISALVGRTAVLCSLLIALPQPAFGLGPQVPDLGNGGAGEPAPEAEESSWSSFIAGFGFGSKTPQKPQPQATRLSIPLRREVFPVKHKGRVVSFKTSYSGIIYVGEVEPQAFRVVFDTGSGHLILPSTECKSTACNNKTLFEIRNSARVVNMDMRPVDAGRRDEVTIGFGKGNVEGFFGADTVCLQSRPGVPASERVDCVDSGLVLATKMSSDPFEHFEFDAILGLGLPSLAVRSRFSLLGNLAAGNGFIGHGYFGVFLAEGDDEEASEISFGSHNPDRVLEPLTWVPLTRPGFGYWLVEVLGMYVDDVKLDMCNTSRCIGILDTGTSHLGLPPRDLPVLAERLLRKANGMMDCRKVKAPVVKIELPGFNLSMRPENYMRRLPLELEVADEMMESFREAAANAEKPPGEQEEKKQEEEEEEEVADPNAPEPELTECTARLMSISLPTLGPNAILLGEPALHRYYTAYDANKKRAGFALAARKKRKRSAAGEESLNKQEILSQMRGEYDELLD